MNLRRAAKADANKPQCVKALHKAGGWWVDLGYPVDGFAWLYGRWVPCELKDGSKPPSARKLTDAQEKFQRDCQAYKAPFVVATGPEDLLRQLEALSGPP